MRGDSPTIEGFAGAVIAEPPLALRPNFEVARDTNERLAKRLRAAGIPRVTVPQAGAFHDVNTAVMDVRRATA